MSICLIDTSIFVEVLQVPGQCSHHGQIVAELKEKIEGNEKLFLPIATIVETGNHIAQNGDGRQRRACAERFLKQVRYALSGESPFNPISFDAYAAMRDWLDSFHDFAMQGVGFADLSIIADFDRMCQLNATRAVYVWSRDKHLMSYSRGR